MAPIEDRPSWPPESESSATGGHLTSESSGSFGDAVSPVERSTTRTDVIPRATPVDPARTGRRRVAVRRVRRTLRKIDPLSVLKLSLFFYTIFLIVWLVAVAMLYSILESMGLFNTIEDLADAFAVNWESNISLFVVERWAFLIGLTFVVLGSIVNVLLAFLYNVASDLVGGVEVTFAERDG
ncbi:MAG TPA: DUF3566 domain-containing protein [Actinomycetota bacterium]|nr:DUF3566 domain-containing protein [Actinomycetota bacterium]